MCQLSLQNGTLKCHSKPKDKLVLTVHSNPSCSAHIDFSVKTSMLPEM